MSICSYYVATPKGKSMTKIVIVSTDLPIAAETACALAQKPALLQHILWPWLSMNPDQPLPATIGVGDEISTRLRFFRVIPAWTHTLRVESLTDHELASSEWGGPVKAWNHTLTFTPTSENSCRYTDRVEVAAGPMTPLVAVFARLIYRYRQARWRRLARVLA
jgi:hypothetical protein